MDEVLSSQSQVLSRPRHRARAWLSERLALRPADRVLIYCLVGLAFYVGACGAAGARAMTQRSVAADTPGRAPTEPPPFLRADALGYWAYLPSVVIDGDIDFTNQPLPGAKRAIEAGRRPPNRWPIGVALTVWPCFVAGHVVATGLHAATGSAWFTPDGYSFGYFAFTLAGVVGFAVFGFVLADRLIVERYGVRPISAVLAILLIWGGTKYAWYLKFEPFLSHVTEAAWLCVAVYALHRVVPPRGLTVPASRPVLWLAVLAFALSMATVCRLSNVVFVPLGLLGAWQVVRNGGFGTLLRAMPICLIAWFPLALQGWVWWELPPMPPMPTADTLTASGVAVVRPSAIGYPAGERFHWTEPALLRVLFSTRKGLFVWSPVLLLAAWGLIVATRRAGLWRDPVLIGLMGCAAALWYLVASWYAWWFGSAFGQRGLFALKVLWVIGMAWGVTWLRGLPPPAKRLASAAVAGALVVHFVLAALFLAKLIPHDDYVSQWEKRTAVGRWERL